MVSGFVASSFFAFFKVFFAMLVPPFKMTTRTSLYMQEWFQGQI